MSEEQGEYKIFSGFDKPTENYSKLPHGFVECLPLINSLAELKVVLYTLRHTWGFSEFGVPKKITTDEYMNGRKRRDGTRMDSGTGLANNSVITGLEKAIEHGFMLVEVDETDRARIEKLYCLNMLPDVQNLHSGVQDLHSGYAKVAQRSEKETKVRNSKKVKAAATPKTPTPPEVLVYREVTKLYPPKNNFDSVVKIIQSVSKRLGRPATADDLLPFFNEWTFRGFKKTNINWTSWAVSGVIPNSKQVKQTEPKAFQGIRDYVNSLIPEEVVDVFAG